MICKQRSTGPLALLLLLLLVGHANADECTAADHAKAKQGSQIMLAAFNKYSAAKKSGNAASLCREYQNLLRTAGEAYPLFASMSKVCGLNAERTRPEGFKSYDPGNCGVVAASPGNPPPGGTVPPNPGGWQGTSDPADCARANSVERSSAAWGTMCAQGGKQQPQKASPGRTPPVAAAAPNPPAQPGIATPPAAPPIVASAPNPPPRQSSGASTAPPAAPLPAGPGYVLPGDATKHWMGTSVPTDCDNANKVEKSSAFWGYMCVPEKPGAMALDERKRPYTSPIKTQDLWTKATEACKDVLLEARRSCIRDFKVAVLLNEEPNVRKACTQEAQGRDSLITCVETIYLYGPKGLQHYLRDSLGGARVVETPMTEWHPDPKPLERVDLCPLGSGLQPGDPRDSFGAWTCQPLDRTGVDRGPSAAQATAPADASDPRQAFEQRVNRTAAIVVAAVADAGGANLMSAEDRKTCLDEAYAAVRSVYKGGWPAISEQCRGMADAAFAELAYYAREGFDTGNENLLSVLSSRNPKTGSSIGGNLGAPQPGMTNLTPYPQTAPPPAVDCAQAETDWKNAEGIRTLRVYEDHLARFPSCDFATLARARIAALKK